MTANNNNNDDDTPTEFNWLTERPFGQRYYELKRHRQQLPIYAHEQEFLDKLATNRVVLVEAHTGSGKTTQIPQWCLKHVYRQQTRLNVVCTQPRRIAAIKVAARVAEELDVQLGEEVGYRIRFECACSDRTRLLYCTDGMLLHSLAMADPQLKQFAVIVLDEVHERRMDTDVLLALMKRLLLQRDGVRIVVMSASLKDSGDFQRFYGLNGCAMLSVPSRLHPIQTIFSNHVSLNADSEAYFTVCINKVMEIHRTQPAGDILLFLTTGAEIEEACLLIEEYIKENRDRPMLAIPFYSDLPTEKRDAVFDKRPRNVRRCIVATNIAESSLTIDGIVYVVDSGLAIQRQYDRKQRMYTVCVGHITKASAKQRTGRAGRTAPGFCYRMYTQHCYARMKEYDAEIMHMNLSSIVLCLFNLGIKDIYRFEFMERPPDELLRKAERNLTDLGAIDANKTMTALGKKILELPVDPPIAIFLIKAAALGCAREAIIIAAMLSAASIPFIWPRKRDHRVQAKIAKAELSHPEGDHFTLYKVFREFDKHQSYEWCRQHFLKYNSLSLAIQVKLQLEMMMERRQYTINSISDPIELFPRLRQALMAGFFNQVAFFKETGYGNFRQARDGYYIPADVQIDMVQAAWMNSKKPLEKGNRHGRPFYRIAASSVLAAPGGPFVSNRPEWVLYDTTNGPTLQTVTMIKNPALLVPNPASNSNLQLHTQSWIANEPFRAKLAEVLVADWQRRREQEQHRQNRESAFAFAFPNLRLQ